VDTFDNYEYDEISNQVWSDNYKAPTETSRKDTWDRAAEACASVEKPEIRAKIAADFKSILYNDRFIPGGRILANLGVPGREGTTQYNCFVHNPEDIGMKDPDSIEGIYNLLKAQAKTLKSEGGYGINASFIRPAGSYIYGVGARTPGVLKFMELWDKSSEIITQGSTKVLGKKQANEKNKIRKGAQMLILEIWHPDIKDFIVAKQTPGRLTKFNVSVGVTDAFMEALYADSTWDLKYPDTSIPQYKEEWFGDISDWEAKGYPVFVYETVKASELWELITKSTYNRNEPGILFLGLANRLNPLHWCDKIKTTNPCFSGDTLIAVADGRNAVPIKQLADEEVDVPVYSLNKETGMVEIKTARHPRITGYGKKLVRVTLDDDSHFDVTPDHKCLLRDGTTVLAKDLQPGDSLPRFSKTPEKPSKDSQYYYRIACDTRNPRNAQFYEHRLLGKFYHPEIWGSKENLEEVSGWLKGGVVVHHKDYNGLNNAVNNLEVMTFKEHQQLHANEDCAGEKNGHFYGNASEQIKARALELCKKLGRPFSNNEWEAFAKENKLPITFSKMHHTVLGKSSTALAKICAIELGMSTVSVKIQKTLKLALEQGYNAQIIDGEVFVIKICEGCQVECKKPYVRRELSYCSDVCGTRNSLKKQVLDSKQKQARIWSQLAFNLKRDPDLVEWENACKAQKVSFRLRGSDYGFQSYVEVTEAGRNYNHKVVSVVELEGEHTVYNLTVDDNHTVSIVTDIKTKDDKPPAYIGIHVMQCGEIAMATGVCLLGSLNLVTFVKEVSPGSLTFDFGSFRTSVATAIRFLDNINDISPTPLPEYDRSIVAKRRIGLGVMGLGSLHLMLGIKYGSPASLTLVESIFRLKSETELLASARLGAEKGSFPLFDADKYFSSAWWSSIDISVKEEVQLIGCMRNSHQSMNAPTGNTGIYARNVSGGIEPVFNADGYYRWSIVPENRCRELLVKGLIYPEVGKGEWFETAVFKFTKRGDEQVLAGTFEGKNYEIDKNRGLVVSTLVEDYGMKFAKSYYGDKFADMKAAGAFTSSEELSIEDHLSVLTVCAHFTNMSISKTVNIPNDYAYEDFQKVYLYAYENGIKGITTYRAGTMTAVIEAAKIDGNKIVSSIFTENHSPKRGNELLCDIVHATVNGEKWTFIVGLFENKPYEVFGGLSKFIQIPRRVKQGKVVKHSVTGSNISRYDLHYDFETTDNETVIKDITSVFENKTNASFTRTISLSLRHGVPIQYIVEQLTKGSDKEDELFSFSKAVSRVLKNYIKDGTKPGTKKCPECASERLVYKEGCASCLDCSYSKCS
jgi:ribonucleotide reductase alpha subunit